MTAGEPDTTADLPRGLAVASVILGVAALAFSPLLLGALVALVGLPLAILYLGRGRAHRAVAWWGLALSLAGLLASVSFGAAYYRIYTRMVDGSDDEDTVGRRSSYPRTSTWVGTSAPPLVVRTLDGQDLDLGDLKGRRVVLNFWATWCAACRQEMPHLDQLARETDDGELTMVAISDEDAATIQAYATKNGLQIPMASASALPAPFDDLEAIPTTVYIDRNGVIQESAVGYQSYETLRKRALPGVDYAEQVRIR